jgi:hypothetical protein
MNVLFRLGAFLSAVLLSVVIGWASGYLAAIPSPRGFFEFFGHDHPGLGFFVFSFFVYALPVSLFSFAWCWVTLRIVPSSTRTASWWCLAGIAFVWLYFQVDGALDLHNHPIEGQFPIKTILLSMYVKPVFWLGTLASPVGLALAAWLVHRSRHRPTYEARA